MCLPGRPATTTLQIASYANHTSRAIDSGKQIVDTSRSELKPASPQPGQDLTEMVGAIRSGDVNRLGGHHFQNRIWARGFHHALQAQSALCGQAGVFLPSALHA